jgi:hypothetical protein
MNCQAVRDRLMQGESLQVKDWPRSMNRHLKECPTCAKLARNLYKLEDAWRNQPIPEECEAAKATFLDKLNSMAAPPQVEADEQPATVKFEQPAKPRKAGKQKGSSKPARRQPGSMRWAALAAMVLIGISVVAVMFATNNKAQANDSDIVERLIDFNLELTNAEPNERKKVYDKRAADLKKAMEKAGPILSKDELARANKLFEDSGFLATNDSPVEEAKRLTAISDDLLTWAEAAESSGNKKEIERFGGRYAKFWNEGVSPMQKGASPLFKKFKGFDPEKYGKNGFEKITPPEKGGGSGFQKGIGFEVGPEFDWEAYIQQQRLLAMIYMQSMQYARPQVHINFNLYYVKGRGGRH